MGKRIIFLFLLVVAGLSTFLASWFALHGDIVFHTDIARDFLLMEDVVYNKPITLIGPRSGGIPGVFHGPLWTYLNLPAFLIGGGNPAVVGWFWVILYLINLWIVYKIGSLIFKKEVGAIAAALTSIITAFSVPGLFNPFGAVMATPVFLYFLNCYVKEGKIKDLLITLFVLGLIIQFQMAFGGPLLLLFLPLLAFLVIRGRKLHHLFGLLILLIPLSTFILFDLRHQFLQTRSVINYLTGAQNSGKVEKPLGEMIKTRVQSVVNDGPGFITKGRRFAWYLFIILLAASLYKVFKKNQYKDKRSFYLLFFYFYIGYWLTTVLYQGVIWGYYYWPFLSLITLVFASTYNFVNKKIFYVILLILVIFNFEAEIKNNFKPASYFGQDGSSWRFHYKTAKTIYDDAPWQFGYYIFTADQFGYSSRYGMNYLGRQYKNKKAFPYEKKEVVYLMIAPSNNPTISDDWWKREKVKIRKAPEKIFRFEGSNFRIEKYRLTSGEIKEKSDENLIHTLIFR